jgi:hypothetical protein
MLISDVCVRDRTAGVEGMSVSGPCGLIRSPKSHSLDRSASRPWVALSDRRFKVYR